VHVDERVLPGGFFAGDQDGVGVADQPDVRQALVGVRPRDGELAGQIVGRERLDVRTVVVAGNFASWVSWCGVTIACPWERGSCGSRQQSDRPGDDERDGHDGNHRLHGRHAGSARTWCSVA
jgi:hypothetical protein